MLVPSDQCPQPHPWYTESHLSPTGTGYTVRYTSDALADGPKVNSNIGRHHEGGAANKQARKESRCEGEKKDGGWKTNIRNHPPPNPRPPVMPKHECQQWPATQPQETREPQLHCASRPHTERPVTSLKTLILLCRCAVVLVSGYVAPGQVRAVRASISTPPVPYQRYLGQHLG
ncbi:hypothetical protein LY76DRAFT_589613 [Colletotrichum caudatum]|nr:hypothetical protein LY76DRAFT_589613 [Colletotrichum caudatum]